MDKVDHIWKSEGIQRKNVKTDEEGFNSREDSGERRQLFLGPSGN